MVQLWYGSYCSNVVIKLPCFLYQGRIMTQIGIIGEVSRWILTVCCETLTLLHWIKPERDLMRTPTGTRDRVRTPILRSISVARPTDLLIIKTCGPFSFPNWTYSPSSECNRHRPTTLQSSVLPSVQKRLSRLPSVVPSFPVVAQRESRDSRRQYGGDQEVD